MEDDHIEIITDDFSIEGIPLFSKKAQILRKQIVDAKKERRRSDGERD
jgi:hypothetical protein